MRECVCRVCGCQLSGGVDTFGDLQHEMCWDDYMAMIEDNEGWALVAKSLFGPVAGLTDTEEF